MGYAQYFSESIFECESSLLAFQMHVSDMFKKWTSFIQQGGLILHEVTAARPITIRQMFSQQSETSVSQNIFYVFVTLPEIIIGPDFKDSSTRIIPLHNKYTWYLLLRSWTQDCIIFIELFIEHMHRVLFWR